MNVQGMWPDIMYTKLSFTLPVNLVTDTGPGPDPAPGVGVLRDASGGIITGNNPFRGVQFNVGPDKYERSTYCSQIQVRYKRYTCYKAKIQFELQNFGQASRFHVFASQASFPTATTGEQYNAIRDANGRWKYRTRNCPQPGNGMAPTFRMSLTCDPKCVYGISRARLFDDEQFSGSCGTTGTIGTGPAIAWGFNPILVTTPEGSTTQAQVVGTMRLTHWVKLWDKITFDDASI